MPQPALLLRRWKRTLAEGGDKWFQYRTRYTPVWVSKEENQKVIQTKILLKWITDNAVGTALRMRTGRLRTRGSIPCRVKRLYMSSLKQPDRLWDPPSFLFIG
jgi:hypothetical protein